MRIKELDGLRGIAILMVVACHYLPWLPATGAQHGWLGVDLFFVLSGYLITTILVNLRGSERYFSVFYARRALRIFPIYYLAIFIYLAFSLTSVKPGTLRLWLSYLFYYTSLGVGQPPELGTSFLLAVQLGLAVLWSLSVEEIYYTIWAPIVRFTSQRVFSGILIGMIVIAPLLRWWLHTPDFPEVYIFYCRMDALAMGSMVSLLVLAQNAKSNGNRLDKVLGRVGVSVGLITLIFWMWLRGDRSKVLLTTVGICLVDVSFALFTYAVIRRTGTAEWWVRVLRTKWLRSVGTISYSLYVFHYPILEIVGMWISPLGLPRRVDAVVHVVVAFGVSMAVSYSLWYLLETHILKWKDRHVPSESAVTPVGLLASEKGIDVVMIDT